ncbi:hypothetical protein [Phycicoccus sp. Soil748]|uniref:hypothetical protein n=1 Tax=Intrasporangiaceae TaxID=85021 RepID=UPI0012E37BA8|nr:hypothetical protein [Phycicoccus sp. Soil748]
MTSSRLSGPSATTATRPPSGPAPDAPADGRAGAVLAAGAGVATALFAVAVVVARLPGVDVHAGLAAPMLATWGPRVGLGSVPVLVLVWWSATARPWGWVLRLSWSRLMVVAWASSAAWMVSLALVDGVDGIGAVLDRPSEYLSSARAVDDVGDLLRSFVSRIPLTASDSWPVHVAGHPPGALLFFVALSRIGMGSGPAAGLVVVAVAATVPVAVAVTCRGLGEQARLRPVLPFLVMGPFAVWQAVSADAVFAAAAAWTVALAAMAGAARRRPVAKAWAGAAGVGLGACAMLSYGLPLMAVVVLAVLAGARGWTREVARLLGVVAVGVASVMGGFALAGFAYWDAYPVLHQRYWDGLATARPAAYWLWADVALLAVCAGPVLFGALALSGHRLLDAFRHPQRDPLMTLVAGAVVAVVLADLSLMSKAEVERIWLPFVPWLLLSTVTLPARWRRSALVGQVGLGLLVQSLLVTPW